MVRTPKRHAQERLLLAHGLVKLSLGLALALSLALSSAAHAEEPRELVQAFIADFQTWNDRAIAADGGEAAMKQAEADYARLLGKFCLPGFRGQPIAYGTYANHTPELEKIQSQEVSRDQAIVRSVYVRVQSGVTLRNEYEYHLVRKNGRWYLTSVLYLIDGRKLEGL